MEQRMLSILVITLLCNGIHAMTRAQLKNSAKMFKKSCLGKVDVNEDLIVDIEKGQFVEDRSVMCYIACIYQMSQIVKNNKLNYEASLKQVDIMYPAEMKDAVKATITECKDVSKKYKDLCEASFYTAKCIYTADPKNFVFA